MQAKIEATVLKNFILAAATFGLCSCTSIRRDGFEDIINNSHSPNADLHLIPYLEPQDDFSFIKNRLTANIQAGVLNIEADDKLALNRFIYGLDEEGLKPALLPGHCNQMIALVQAIFCVLPNPSSKETYLGLDQISGFYDENLSSALVKWRYNSQITDSFRAKSEAAWIQDTDILELLRDAHSNKVLKY
jgi:hypothetical protein